MLCLFFYYLLEKVTIRGRLVVHPGNPTHLQPRSTFARTLYFSKKTTLENSLAKKNTFSNTHVLEQRVSSQNEHIEKQISFLFVENIIVEQRQLETICSLEHKLFSLETHCSICFLFVDVCSRTIRSRETCGTSGQLNLFTA